MAVTVLSRQTTVLDRGAIRLWRVACRAPAELASSALPSCQRSSLPGLTWGAHQRRRIENTSQEVVAVRQGDPAGTSDSVFFFSTGGRQVVSTEAFGPFNPGDAIASATLVCGPLVEGLQLGETIKISK